MPTTPNTIGTIRLVKRTERGWAGHFICASRCMYRRNTLLECGRRRIVVSTVGNYRPDHRDLEIDSIGLNRYYETMVFRAVKDGVYWEADTNKQLNFDAPWSIDKVAQETDLEADAMHEAVVQEMAVRMLSNNLK